MLSVSNLSNESVDLLQIRGRSDQQIIEFATLLDEVNSQIGKDVSAKDVLSGLTVAELIMVQKSVGLVDSIDVDSLSTEAAINLLAQPDKTGMIDLNNDGLVEIGAAKMITFPPVNAPVSVQRAWDEATEGMSEQDKMIMQLNMHTMTYGIHIDGVPTQQASSPEDQWSKKGLEQLMENLKSALEFSVSLDGWDRFNLVKNDFYDKFEEALEE
ncbi:MAG: hypothetical protein ACI9T7_001085 [Oleiphilaceae bacterium]|jgi:hypothetical protein